MFVFEQTELGLGSQLLQSEVCIQPSSIIQSQEACVSLASGKMIEKSNDDELREGRLT